MRPVSAAFMRSLSGSHKAVVRATVCSSFQTGVQPVGTRVDIVDGSVTLDAKADVRGQLDITVNAPWPIRANDLMAPYGNEIYVERGIQYNEGEVEYVGLGYFRIDDDANDVPIEADIIRVTGYDRMKGIIEGRLLEPQQFLVGTTLGTLVATLVQQIYPTAQIEWDEPATRDATLIRSVIVEDDRFGFLNDAIQSVAKIWYWDHRGVLVIKDVPDPAHPVTEIVHGTGGVLVNVGRSLTRDGTYNAVVAIGESTDNELPVRGSAIDDDVNSPTYFFGRFGQVPMFFSSQFLITDDQCDRAAQSLLDQQLGLSYRINFGTIVNPALEPYDPVWVKHSHSEAKQVHVLDTVNVPLVIGQPLTSETRERRVTLVV